MKQMIDETKKKILVSLQCTKRSKEKKILMSSCGSNVEDLLNKVPIRLEWERWLKWERVRAG